MIQAYHLENILGEGTLLNSLLTVLNACGNIIFTNLPIIFAMGVAIGMAKKEKEVAALSGAIAFFVMHSAINAMLSVTGIGDTLPVGSLTNCVGIESLQMGVFGGIIVGLGVAALHNKFYKIQITASIILLWWFTVRANYLYYRLLICWNYHVLYLATNSRRYLYNW